MCDWASPGLAVAPQCPPEGFSRPLLLFGAPAPGTYATDKVLIGVVNSQVRKENTIRCRSAGIVTEGVYPVKLQ
jgi:hypothetical protein